MKGGEGVNQKIFMVTDNMGIDLGGEKVGLSGGGEREKKWKKL